MLVDLCPEIREVLVDLERIVVPPAVALWHESPSRRRRGERNGLHRPLGLPHGSTRRHGGRDRLQNVDVDRLVVPKRLAERELPDPVRARDHHRDDRDPGGACKDEGPRLEGDLDAEHRPLREHDHRLPGTERTGRRIPERAKRSS